MTFLNTLFDIFNDRGKLFRLRAIHHIRHIVTHHRLVGWNNNCFQTINLLEFKRFGISGTRHTRQLFIQTEVVLESDRSQSLVFVLDLHPFFCFYRLVQTIRPATTRHSTTGMFINDHHFTIGCHDVIDVLFKQNMRT
ncbi:Uncharacterised protein [Vibrio cholerae]|uniref:Uncharacterized protein n=1 Tax=Vibrio cholerae TaxID=666 RepID=A0A655UDN6_VIBCL|nr:Uncharacterised protein [Vibrio cholerae]CSB49288.1 Uncharacterised protein [Vibrio cholerae]CSB83130.1 Uncharacterised protein [Vibrio cholerae]CSC77980.1 Uncharacterised protein [Vibrio cholerae]CSC89440.1 Uncharacterised protein [Vibrio cholerae]